jgi:hypothetical protein
MKAFSEETGLKLGAEWSAALPTDAPTSGYHVHFNGSSSKELVRFRIEYYDTVLKRGPENPLPSAESIMAFAGSFVLEPRYRALVYATFENEEHRWVSRFNLPFKVTMAGREVAIDGVSLVLPKNEFGALDGWVSKIGTAVIASVSLVRAVEFSSFNIEKELEAFNESVKIFVEQMT